MPAGYDVIIIGSGAGGGTLARQLAPTKKRILILERGDWLKREALNWDAKAVFVDNRYISPDTWYDASGRAFQPQVHYFVGGATKMYGAALYRLRRRGFRRASRIRRHLAGLAHHLRGNGALLRQGRADVPGARHARRGPD
jgi:choline dehydrogenase-like flavoprotein